MDLLTPLNPSVRMKVTPHFDPTVTVVEPKGSLVGGDVLDDLKTTMHGLLDAGTHNVVLDLSGVDLVNSTGLGSLISINAAFQEKGGRVKLAGLDKKIKNIFVLTRLSEVFDIAETQQDALMDFRHTL